MLFEKAKTPENLTALCSQRTSLNRTPYSIVKVFIKDIFSF